MLFLVLGVVMMGGTLRLHRVLFLFLGVCLGVVMMGGTWVVCDGLFWCRWVVPVLVTTGGTGAWRVRVCGLTLNPKP